MFNYYEFKDGTNITYLELLKPDGTSLGELKNAYNRVSKLSLGEVSELSFTLPNVKEVFFQNYGDRTEEEIIEIENKLNNYPKTNNEDIGKASISVTGYQVKAVYSNGLEVRFVIPNKSISSDMMKVDTNFTCYSLEHELAKQLVIDYRGVLINGEYTLDGLTLEEVSRDLLGGTFWEIDFLDVGYNETDVNPMMRTVDAFNNVSLLAALDSVCATFGAIPEYDTINRKVSFYRADNTEHYKYNGLLIDDSNYMNNIKQTNNADEMITRLYGLGANSLTINGVNPAGVSYIEDLSYFIYPANLNADKTGLTKPSKYMSDDLAYAELIYEDKIANLIPTFNDLQTQKDTKTKELIVLENELTALQTALNIIKDYIDVMFVGMSTAVDTNPDYVAKRTEMDNTQIAVNNKQVEIVTKKEEIANINLQLKQLYEDIKIENNFTTDELKERQNFIYEGLYTNTGINIEQDLYEEMIEFLEKKKEPSISIDVGINSILSMKSKNQTKDALKIKIGEQIDVYYNYKGIDIDIRAQILSITIDEEQNTLDLEIANTQDYKKSSADYLENILKRSITTSTVVDNNVIDWNKGVIALDELDDIYTNGIDAAKIQIDSAAQQSVKINERGITITDTSEPLRFMRATNGVIALTKDGGRTYSTAITPEGVWAERLIGQIILGSQLIIVSDDPTTSLKIQDIPMNTYNDRKSDGTVVPDDFGITVLSNTNRIFVTRERGFKITTPSGKTLFEARTDGVLRATGIEIISDNGKSILDGVNILQTWQDTVQDSLDASYPFTQYVYIPPETSTASDGIRRAMLRFKFLNYRAYSRAIQDGGGKIASTTSGSGGYYGSTVNGEGAGETAHQHKISVNNGKGLTLVAKTPVNNNHKHKQNSGLTAVTDGPQDDEHQHYMKFLSKGSDVSSDYAFLVVKKSAGSSFGPCGSAPGGYLMAVGPEGQGFTSDTVSFKTVCTIQSHIHSFSVPNHTHSVSITLPDHTHEISFGIYESSAPANVRVSINGTYIGGTYNGDTSLDIKNYLIKGQWNSIQFTSTQLGRIQSTVFVQAMMGVVG